MTTLRQAAQQALEALENSLYPQQKQLQAIDALRAALAEQNKCTHGVENSCKECYMADEQEPVFDCPRCGHCCPQRKPLSEEEVEKAYRHIYHNVPDGSYRTTYYWIEQGIRYAEQAHGIKGEA